MNQQASRSLKQGQRVYLNGSQEALTYSCGDLVARGRKIPLTSLADTDVLTNCFGDTISMYGGEVIEAAPATNNIAQGIIDKSGRVINLRRSVSATNLLDLPGFISDGDGQGYDNPYVNTVTGYRNPGHTCSAKCGC